MSSELRTLYVDTITSYHEDGTDYINDELRAKVHAAIERYVGPMDERNLAAVAAISAVREWLVPVTVNDLDIEAAAKAWAETISHEVDQLAVDPLASKQALKILRAALGGTKFEPFFGSVGRNQ